MVESSVTPRAPKAPQYHQNGYPKCSPNTADKRQMEGPARTSDLLFICRFGAHQNKVKPSVAPRAPKAPQSHQKGHTKGSPKTADKRQMEGPGREPRSAVHLPFWGSPNYANCHPKGTQRTQMREIERGMDSISVASSPRHSQKHFNNPQTQNSYVSVAIFPAWLRDRHLF